MYQKFKFKPPGSRWIRCEFEAEFGCDKSPQIASEDPKIRILGLRSIGLGITHEYIISTPRIEDSKKQSASLADCSNPTSYAFTLSYEIGDAFGFGIKVGEIGTGFLAGGSDTVTRSHHFITNAFCCDDMSASPAEQGFRIRLSRGGVPQLEVIAMALVASTLLLAHQTIDRPDLGRLFLQVLVVLAAVSAAIALWRWRSFRRAEPSMPAVTEKA